MKSSGIIAAAAILLLPSLGIAAAPAGESSVEKGKALALDTNKGNCIACHMMGDGEFPGNYGPPLIQMKERYPDRAALHKQIGDATIINPKSIMPPFGKHGILNVSEIDQIVDYLYTL
ncbi:sulfur oxidation c-type cytochrome SoxX [Chlorobaculum thiosulfatiphilum]|uniref:Cytochrome c n=2 Tax=Chlorobiaceae TaxID=191412 RepID=Q8RLX3_CHLLI|nr:sulfur oxidation c-type cytochrome SoxX [Chlorobaculum thiosulfatiphilum]AAL68883.1 cytochrome c [Chlorobium limicola]TNJ36577.1 sulfur oxidation c-type cytochrome SoxX [Chlorobaculum thiosulfatiphilum]